MVFLGADNAGVTVFEANAGGNKNHIGTVHKGRIEYKSIKHYNIELIRAKNYNEIAGTNLTINPTVTLRSTTDITASSAMVHMTVSNPSHLLITARGTQIRKKGASAWEKTFNEDLSKKTYNKDSEITGAFTFGSGKEVNYALSSGTIYEYRCFCTYNGKNYYSSISTFTTIPGGYTFNFNSNGGTGSMNQITVKKNQDFTLPANKFAKKGSIFQGWNVKRNSDGKFFVSEKGWLSTSEISAQKVSKKLYANQGKYNFSASWQYGSKENDSFTFYAVWKACSAHKWDGGKVTKAATTTATGTKTYTCTLCGQTKTETIPKTAATNPTVSLRATTDITTSSAMVHMTVSNPSKLLITARGTQIRKPGETEWAKTFTEDLSKKDYNKDKSITGAFTFGSGKEVDYALSAGTKYEFRCFCTYNGQNYYSKASTFTTKKDAASTVKMPSVTLRATTDITTSSAMVHMTVSNPSKLLITARGTQIRKPGETEWAKTFTEDLSKKDYNKDKSITGAFTFGSGKEVDYALSAGTKYEFRCFCTYNGQNYYSKASTFTTKKATTSTVKMPSVTLRATTDITTSSAMVHMTVSNPSKLLITARGTQIRRPGASEWEKTFTEDLSKKDYNKDKSITGAFTYGSGKEVDYTLSPGMTYEYRCFCTYNGNNYYSKTSSFKTTDTSSYKYTVKYNANGGKGTMTAMTVAKDTDFILPENQFTKAGYTFAGWTVKRSSDNKWYVPNEGWKTTKEIKDNGWSKKVYESGEEYRFNAGWINGSKTSDTYTFYAVWKTCEHEWDEGVVTNEPTTSATGVMTYTCEICGKTKTAKIPKISTYQIKFNANGGKGSIAGMKVEKEESFTLPENSFTKAGYTFVGWSVKRSSDSKWLVEDNDWQTNSEIKANGSEKMIFDEEADLALDEDWINGSKSTDTYTFYAVWEKDI